MNSHRGMVHIVVPAVVLVIIVGAYAVWFTYTGSQLDLHTTVTAQVTGIRQTDTTTIVEMDATEFTFLGTNLSLQLNHNYTIECVSTTLDRYNPFAFSVVWRIVSITEVV